MRKPVALFISDIHLGTPQCKADMLLEFLKHYQDIDSLYLVGDIIDVWALSRKIYWPESHNTVIQKILRLARRGSNVTFVIGNHDEALRQFLPLAAGNIQLLNQAVFYAGNKKVLILHGDEFDGVVRSAKWLYWLGDTAYTAAMAVSSVLSMFRRKLHMQYWSLSAYLKKQVKEAVKFIGNFEKLVVNKAERENAHVVVCGHIHTPAIKYLDNILYVNDGDWCESCTAAVLYDNGDIDVVKHDNTVMYSHKG